LSAPGTMSVRDQSLIAGIDIGGTKIGVCVGTSDGRVHASDRLGVDRSRAPEEMLGECRDALVRLIEQRGRTLADIQAVGCACPGPLDYAAGGLMNLPNNPRWHGFGLRDWLKSSFACPSAMMNDANAAALAEYLWGAARDSLSSVFLTMSTGMGAGLILDGRLYEGPHGLAGEIGRIRLRDTDDGPVGFGRRGSVEGYCSGPGMSQLAMSEATAATHRSETSLLARIVAEHGGITSEQLCRAAMQGDAPARRATDRAAAELGRIMAIMADILNPELFVLGTIGTAYPDLFIPRATEVLKREALPAVTERIRILPSGLSDRGNQQALAVAARLLTGEGDIARGARP